MKKIRTAILVALAVLSGILYVAAGDVVPTAIAPLVEESSVAEASHNCVYQWVVTGYGGIGGSKCTHLNPGQRQRVWVYCSNGGPPTPGPWRYNGGEWSYARCGPYYYLTNVAQEVAWYI